MQLLSFFYIRLKKIIRQFFRSFKHSTYRLLFDNFLCKVCFFGLKKYFLLYFRKNIRLYNFSIYNLQMKTCFWENECAQDSLIQPYLIINRRMMHAISESGDQNMMKWSCEIFSLKREFQVVEGGCKICCHSKIRTRQSAFTVSVCW